MEKKRVGRPVVEASPGERAGLSLRVTPDVKRKLEQAAQARGRSLSQEAEFRLERSFELQGLLPDVLFLAFSEGWADFLSTHAQSLDLLPEPVADHIRDQILLNLHAYEEWQRQAELSYEKRKEQAPRPYDDSREFIDMIKANASGLREAAAEFKVTLPKKPVRKK